MNIAIASELGLVVQDKHQIADAMGAFLGSDGLLLTEQDVGPGFFRLDSGLAGELLQKLVNYRIKTAFVCADPGAHGPRFAELAFEHATHPQVRFFRLRQEAMEWLLGGGAGA